MLHEGQRLYTRRDCRSGGGQGPFSGWRLFIAITSGDLRRRSRVSHCGSLRCFKRGCAPSGVAGLFVAPANCWIISTP